ncbi:ParB/RepB/Spo0J family partition protein [Chloroflexus sp.]|uniref:ParB/RepB/Spo0J family partition protein n=1 Tax=Chloroflexus sp. TaxID=1904827 RepID=UPI002ACD7EE8|nr:ParB N-terminal domain-containing protein [Chloroflexus sp.]
MAPRTKTVAQVVEIERERIEVDAGQVRQEKSEGLQELATSFKGGSVIPPLIVTDLGHGKYRLVDGERRWLAAGIAGIERVPCIVQAPKGYLETRIEQMQRNNAQPMTPLEWAQGSYNAYLAANIAALAAEAGVPDPTEGLVEAGLKPTEQREKLEAWLMELAGDTVIGYLTSGRVRVTRKEVFERLGKPTSDAAIKKLWAPLKLPAELQNKLEGTGVSTRTMDDLTGLPEGEQAEAVEAALAAAGEGGDVNAALREEIKARTESKADTASDDVTTELPEADEGVVEPDERGTTGLDWPELDAGRGKQTARLPEADEGADETDMVALAVEERGDDFESDPSLALPFGGGPGGKGKMHVNGPEPGRGSVPPAGFGARWPQPLVLQFSAGLEALLGTFDAAGPATLDEDQQRLLSSMWNELLERAEQAGLSIEVPR